MKNFEEQCVISNCIKILFFFLRNSKKGIYLNIEKHQQFNIEEIFKIKQN